MVSVQRNSIRNESPMDAVPTLFDRANQLASEFAGRAAQHDRDASFPFENFSRLSEAGLLALTVPAALGGGGAGALDAARVIGILGKADPSTALVLSMHYIQHLVMAGMLRPPGVAQLFSEGDVASDEELYGKLGGHLAWRALREFEITMRRKGVRLALFSPETVASQVVGLYQEVKQRQLL